MAKREVVPVDLSHLVDGDIKTPEDLAAYIVENKIEVLSTKDKRLVALAHEAINLFKKEDGNFRFVGMSIGDTDTFAFMHPIQYKRPENKP